MENEKMLATEAREMNFWDLCVAIGRAIGRGCMLLWRVLARMIRLTYKYWYIVLTIVLLALVCAYYYTRAENQIYRVNAIALLNGPTIQQFEQAYAPFKSGKIFSEQDPIVSNIRQHKAHDFASFRVIDCLNDGVADYIDFTSKSSPTDTVKVQMQDRICLQFRMKACDMGEMAQVEDALLAILNANEAIQKSYAPYLSNLREQVAFNHRQEMKLDSLTSVYYFQNSASEVQPHNSEVAFYGERKIHLFLEKIYAHQQHTQQGDYRAQLATAPIVLENHFAVDPFPVNGRIKYMILFFLMGWVGGCVIAQMVDKRKDLAQWLKQD